MGEDRFSSVLRGESSRAIAAGSFLTLTFCAAVGGVVLLDGLSLPIRLLLLAVMVALAVLASGRMVAGRWSARVPLRAQLGGTAALAFLYVGEAAAAIARAADARDAQEALGTSAAEVTASNLLGVAAVLALACMAVALPLAVRRATLIGLLSLLGVLVAAGLAAAAVAASRNGCEAFRFDRTRWRVELKIPETEPGRVSGAERIARAVVRCGVFDGAGTREVRRRLGPPTSKRAGRWAWYVGITNDAIGPGDSQELIVEDGRAPRLLYP